MSTADQVAHMKWWGWGVDGVAFHHENKPGFPPFLSMAIGVDVNEPATAPVTLDELDVPESLAPADLLEALTTALGADNVRTDRLDRVVHTYGKSVRDLIRLRATRSCAAPTS